MFLAKENEKKAYDAMQKIQAVDAAVEWDKLTEEDLFWSLIHCVYEHMNSDQILKRPTANVPWCTDEWKAEVRAKSKKAFDMFLGYMPPEVRQRFSESKTVSADHVAGYLRETWESRDFYDDWRGRWKWRWWGYGHPMPTYKERVEYVYAMKELIEERKKKKEKETRMVTKKKAEEVAETKAKGKGKSKRKAKAKGQSPWPAKSNLVSSTLPLAPSPPPATFQPSEVAVASELPMDVSPSPQDPLTAPPVMAAEKMLSELQL